MNRREVRYEARCWILDTIMAEIHTLGETLEEEGYTKVEIDLIEEEIKEVARTIRSGLVRPAHPKERK